LTCKITWGKVPTLLNGGPFKAAAADVDDTGADTSTSNGEGANYDVSRTLRMGLFGLAFYGPISGAWYGALDQWVLPDAPAGAAAVAAKTTLDQVLWAPVLITSLFAWDLSCSGEG
jgi:protein Mpv17